MLRAMARWFAVVALSVALLAGLGYAAEEPTKAITSIPVVMGDPVWQPTKEQLARWVSDGASAAAAETDPTEMPIVGSMTWLSDNGTPLPGDRALRFAALVTPQLGATIYGYAAAWDDDTWQSLQQDPQGTASKLGGDLLPAFPGRDLQFPIGIHGSRFDDMKAAVYYDGRWWYAEPTLWGGMDAFTADAAAEVMPSARWAAEYLVAQEARYAAFEPAPEIYVYMVRWPSEPPDLPDAGFVAELPKPSWTGPDNARLAVGTAEEFAWVDFDLTP